MNAILTAARAARQRRGGARHRRIRRLGVLAAIGVLATVCSGCLGSGYAYYGHVNGDRTEMYFKLPTSWKTFDSDQVIESANGKLSASQLKQIEAGEWLEYFAASRHVALRSIGNFDSTVPEGEAFAHELTGTTRDEYSLQAMREEFLGTDPLTSTSGEFNVLNYTESTWPGGIRVSRMVVDITNTNRVVATLNQVVAVDPATDWSYGIAISCRVSCYGPNSGVVNQIIDSWTVKELAG